MAPNLAALKTQYAAMGDPPEDADAVWKRARGYEFERVLKALLDNDGLDPRASYKAPGEQIDGSFVLDGRVFLLEAKWHADQLPASTLYQFKGKVDGKLVGTLGVFISMSGFSQDAVDALTAGKSLNVVLFDKPDIDAAIVRGRGFKDVLKLKLRKAAEEGLAYFPAEGDLVSRKSARAGAKAASGTQKFTLNTATSQDLATAPNLIIVCEGRADRAVLSTLVERIDAGQGRRVAIVSANGKLGLPGLANALRSIASGGAQVVVVADSDGDVQETEAFLKRGIDFEGWTMVVADPDLEGWLHLDPSLKRVFPFPARETAYSEAAAKLDLEDLRKDEAFSTLYSAIVEALPASPDAPKTPRKPPARKKK
jgi:hypothetical protein